LPPCIRTFCSKMLLRACKFVIQQLRLTSFELLIQPPFCREKAICLAIKEKTAVSSLSSISIPGVIVLFLPLPNTLQNHNRPIAPRMTTLRQLLVLWRVVPGQAFLFGREGEKDGAGVGPLVTSISEQIQEKSNVFRVEMGDERSVMCGGLGGVWGMK
jgi:hypothetical protein